jgi:TatD DNase family protein
MIDTHVHLHIIDTEPERVIADAAAVGVTHMIQVAIDMASIHANLSIYQHISACSITGGIHPLSITDDITIEDVLAVLTMNQSRFCAIGEIGLDYKYGDHNKRRQQQFFEAQLAFARQHNMPVVIHARESNTDMIAIVNRYPDVRKVFHCYAQPYAFFESLSGNQNYVSFTGMITYAKKGKIVHAIRHIPADRFFIETDSPYLKPKGVTAPQNTPQYLPHIAQHIAQIRDASVEDIVAQTTKNARDFFGLED